MIVRVPKPEEEEDDNLYIPIDAIHAFISDTGVFKAPMYTPESRLRQKVSASFALDLTREAVKEMEAPKFEVLFQVEGPNVDSVVESQIEQNLKPREDRITVSSLRTVEINTSRTDVRKKPLSKHAVSEIMRDTPRAQEEIYYKPGDLDI